MHVWLMHPADCQLGRLRSTPLPQSPDSCIKDRLQIRFPLNAPQRRDGGSRGPFVALIVSQTILGHDLAIFVDRVLLLDVHCCDEDVRDFGGFHEW